MKVRVQSLSIAIEARCEQVPLRWHVYEGQSREPMKCKQLYTSADRGMLVTC